ncbi:hypothetical protein Cs7R123_42550 [Catellatospora sp. TT07R-123]|uniref:ricin-type beta-trefoil lectin domain protein n=1 Tax=Catellatospora sp. TT07R-123 TaxID=2733863 RepID=UPI001B20FDA1|nr:ricin-type beta-trefoil lectin domain protein [Catellatospora sp. TT07R-123]GHJ46913.1 hypothetical protein Cs7R123_42550 [Catellatospora sp. TT07R-123]
MRTSWFRRLSTAAAAAVIGLGAVAASPDSAAAATPAASSIATLMKSYDANSGRIGGGWWTGAVALTAVMTYRQATGDATYDYAISAAFDKNKSGNFTNEYLDDTGWWALVWIQAYDITGNQAYLQMARTDAAYMHDYWDTRCGGGIYWSTARTYKASIANELFLHVTSALHNRVPGDTTYLGWAQAEWNWFNASGLINGSRQVIDGVNVANCAFSTAVYTYNQGVVLAGLSELAAATGDTGLLTSARSIADAAVSRMTRNGVLTEACEPNCGNDGPAFKGIFVRSLRTLATAARSTAYDGFLRTQSDSIIAKDTDSAWQHGLMWAGPVQGISYVAQASAASALIAALGVTSTAGVLKGQESGLCVDVPGGSQANGTRPALWDCNGGANQTWTATASQQLTVYGTKCLDVASGGTADGTAVQLYDCNNTAAQRWTVNPDGTVVNTGSGKCLDAYNHGTANGTLLVIWSCGGGANQKWFRGATTGVLKGQESARCVDVPGGNQANGTRPALWDCNGGANQSWTYTTTDQLTVYGTRCLDAAANGTADGTAVQLYDCNGSSAQQWRVRSDGTVVGVGSGKCLDAYGHGTANGSQLVLWTCNGAANQKWSRS